MFRVFLFIILLIGLVAAIVAYRKGRDWFTWMVVCMLIPPILLFLVILPSLIAKGSEARKCPQCSGALKGEDSFCRRCGYRVPIEMQQCPACGKYVQNAKYCGDCGKPLG